VPGGKLLGYPQVNQDHPEKYARNLHGPQAKHLRAPLRREGARLGCTGLFLMSRLRGMRVMPRSGDTLCIFHGHVRWVLLAPPPARRI
jgi:hypothetical protein